MSSLYSLIEFRGGYVICTLQWQSHSQASCTCWPFSLPAGARERLVLRLPYVFRVCLSVCASALITCAIYYAEISKQKIDMPVCSISIDTLSVKGGMAMLEAPNVYAALRGTQTKAIGLAHFSCCTGLIPLCFLYFSGLETFSQLVYRNPDGSVSLIAWIVV